LLSDGVHSRVDVFTSLAVLGGLFLARSFVHADALPALLIGLYILRESFVLGRKATDSLLDVSAGEDVERRIKAIAEERKVALSGLRTQKRGCVITANLEIELPATLKIDEATRTADLFEGRPDEGHRKSRLCRRSDQEPRDLDRISPALEMGPGHRMAGEGANGPGGPGAQRIVRLPEVRIRSRT
jgi:divalent metal cation (Fe/Co/Zn/Cd) transporter